MQSIAALDKLVWLDLEMTGLNPDINCIIEIATIITNAELTELATGPVLAIHQPQRELAKMDEWNQNQHGQSGLIERVRISRVTNAEAEQQTLSFLRSQVAPGVILCGNSICTDRRFLARHMPELHAFFHYRMLDVSSIKILSELWYPESAGTLQKNSEHLALADIRESIAELRHYRDTIMRR